MAVTNAEAIRFCDDVIRPLCEQARALRYRALAAQTRWYAGLNNAFPNDSTAVNDGREGELVSRLTGADVNSVMSQLIDHAVGMNAEIIEKPCVNALAVNSGA